MTGKDTARHGPEVTDLDRKLLYGCAETLVLALLAEESSYGYQVRRTLLWRSRHSIQFAAGRVYAILHLMERRGWVKRRRVKAGPRRERHYYDITRDGRSELKLRRHKWQAFSSAVDRVLR